MRNNRFRVRQSGTATALTVLSSIVFLCGCLSLGGPEARDQGESLSSFASNAELRRYLRNWIPATNPRSAYDSRAHYQSGALPPPFPYEVRIFGSIIAGAQAVGVPISAIGQGITNTQEAGVDEGGIVKMHGDDILVILRRGRIFTVSTARGGMEPVDMIDAYPSWIDASSDWYDEMLVAEGRVVVIGYSYRRRTTDINRFRISEDGQLNFEDAYQVRADDYYSSRNYASRLIGSELIFYSGRHFPWWAAEPLEILPAIRRSSASRSGRGFKPISSARSVYIPEMVRNDDRIEVDTVRTITKCDLLAAVLDCDAKSVLGPGARSFYVSATAMYVWVTHWQRPGAEDELPFTGNLSMLYRLPLDGSPPSAVGVRGAPLDQFSFREDYDGRELYVLVGAENSGDAFWAGERSGGAQALLRIPLESFGDGASEVAFARYRPLPARQGRQYFAQNRFVGEYLLYGMEDGEQDYEARRTSKLIVVPLEGGDLSEFDLDYGVDRIDIMGGDAVIVGTDYISDDTKLYFTAVDLTSGPAPALGDQFDGLAAEQAETRSHAFFFHPEAARRETLGTPGVIGLPIARPGRGRFGSLVEDSAAMLFLRHADRNFSLLGEIPANDLEASDDGCVASCLDWYGNARPIFLQDRVFALMGYELVESELGDDSVREIARMSFAPAGVARVE